ncbi:MAG: DUF3854 domain-containing protein [Candidatus Hinthialibacter antarcticus]|nr:DUF3854 domain-containing protein [Candidatus Hinthialibacter antarcticus]
MVLCRRSGGINAIAKTDANGSLYWLHPQNNSIPQPVATSIKPIQRADEDTLNAVYGSLLHYLELSPEHHENLLKRGLSEHEIQKRQYRTLPDSDRWKIAKQVATHFADDQLLTTPGFFIKDGNYSPYWTIAGSSGLLIPVRDMQQRIIALKVRVNNDDGYGKYRYLSSSYHGGASSGSHIHIPLFDQPIGNEIRITEGELKADIATALSGLLTISVPGVSNWRMVFSTLKAMKITNVKVAFDQDAFTNKNVGRCLYELLTELKNRGYAIRVEKW